MTHTHTHTRGGLHIERWQPPTLFTGDGSRASALHTGDTEGGEWCFNPQRDGKERGAGRGDS